MGPSLRSPNCRENALKAGHRFPEPLRGTDQAASLKTLQAISFGLILAALLIAFMLAVAIID